jgi:hypothetical protein
MMARPEGRSSIDFKRDPARSTELPVMGTVQEKAPGNDRAQVFKRSLDPAGLWDRI